MSAFKKLDRRDVFITSHLAKKSFYTSGSSNVADQVSFNPGTSGSLIYPGYTFKESLRYQPYSFEQLLYYRSIQELYYSNNVSGSLFLTGSFENYLQSSLNHSGSRNLGDRVGVVSLKRNVVGTGIFPGSFSSGKLSDSYIEDEGNYVLETIAAGGEYIENKPTGSIIEDSEGRIIANETGFLEASEGDYVGDLIYTHGLAIFTEEKFAKYFSNLSSPDLSWKSTNPVYTANYTCKVRDEEFNFSLNPSSLKDEFGNIADNISGSEFKPYVTTIGLYNDSQELIAVAKLGQPIPKSTDTDMTFTIKLDI